MWPSPALHNLILVKQHFFLGGMRVGELGEGLYGRESWMEVSMGVRAGYGRESWVEVSMDVRAG